MSFNYERWKEEQYRTAGGIRVTRTAIPFPKAAFWAGTIWVIVGLAHCLVALALALKLGKPNPLGLIILGLTYLFPGFRTVNGAAAGTIRNGIFSLFYGCVWLMIAVMGAKEGTDPNAMLLALGCGLVGAALTLAAGLAFVASADYQRWRRVN